MSYFAGIDVGSLSSDAVIVDDAGGIKGWAVTETGAHSTNAAEAALDTALERAGLGQDADHLHRGHGLRPGGRAPGGQEDHRDHLPRPGGLHPVSRRGHGHRHRRPGLQGDPSGPENGKVVDFVMNDKCAAGTGRFLEVMAAKLGVGLDDLGRLSLGAEGEVAISSVCTVFAESEVVSLVAKNQPIPQIIKGLHRAVVNRVAAMTGTTGVVEQVIMSGGVAKNQGVVKLMAERLGVQISVPEEPQIVGALGAALHGGAGAG